LFQYALYQGIYNYAIKYPATFSLFVIEQMYYINLMVELLKFALEKERFDAAAYALVYGMIKVKKDGKKEGKKGNKARILRSGAG
jgi:hypothetical protein